MTSSIKFGATGFGPLSRIAGELLMIFLLFSAPVATLQARVDSSRVAQDVRALEFGKPIERELKGGEVHTYQITLAANQYLHVVVDQRGIDVVVTLFGSDGKQLIEMDSPNGTKGPEPVSVVAEASGNHRLQVRSLEKDAAPGRYEVKIEELREARLQDRNRIAAERAFAEGEQLRAQRTAESARKALKKYEESLTLWRIAGDSTREATTLNSVGEVYYDLGDNRKALEFWNQALPISQAVKNHREEADLLNNIGAAYYKLGEIQKALDFYSQSLQLDKTMGNRSGEAYTLNNMGVAYNMLGERQRALDYYNQALSLRRALGDRQGEASTLNNIGRVYDDIGEAQKAFDHYNQALLISRVLGDHQMEATSLHNIGVIYGKLGDNQKALDYNNQTLQLWRVLGNRYGESYTLTNIGMIYNNLGEYQKALDYYSQALQLKQALGDRRGEAATLHNIGGIYSDLHENQKALDYYSQMLTLGRTLGDRTIEASTLYDIGGVYYDLGEKQRAREYFTQALQFNKAVGDRYAETKTLSGIALVDRDLGNLTESRTQIEAALTIIESLRTKVASQELRTFYFASNQKYYEFYIDLLMRFYQRDSLEGHDATALQASERARARSLLETLTEARANIRQGVDSVLVQRERTLQQQINAKEQKRMQLLSSKHTKEQATAAREELDSLLTLYQEIQAQIRITSPRYVALIQPQPLSLKEIQEQVLDNETVLLEYVLGDERSFLWAVTPTTINSFVLPKRTEIDSLARHVYDLLTARNQNLPNEIEEQKEARIAQADKELLEASATLGRTLLEPAAELLGDKRLLIVSDGALQYIPFGALQLPATAGKAATETRSPLLVEHEIVSLPSASVLAVLRREMAGRKPAAKTVAALADPVFASDDPRVKRSKIEAEKKVEKDTSLTKQTTLVSALDRSVRQLGIADTRDGLRRLLFSRREAEGIVKLVSASEGMKALDFVANREIATSAELSQYRIVHFATHGLLNSEHPELSGIVLSLVDENGNEQDGFLRLHEIYNLNLPADLVVLSACQTALGKEIKGEGLVGLTRGFMYAGAPRVVASLWSVQDDATAELMKRFYKKMLGREKLRPAAALQAAQIEMWKTKRWQSPYYWAAFVLQGEWK